MKPREEWKLSPRCPVCGRAMTEKQATTRVCRYEVHAPGCLQRARRVAQAALHAEWPGGFAAPEAQEPEVLA